MKAVLHRIVLLLTSDCDRWEECLDNVYTPGNILLRGYSVRQSRYLWDCIHTVKRCGGWNLKGGASRSLGVHANKEESLGTRFMRFSHDKVPFFCFWSSLKDPGKRYKQNHVPILALLSTVQGRAINTLDRLRQPDCIYDSYYDVDIQTAMTSNNQANDDRAYANFTVSKATFHDETSFRSSGFENQDMGIGGGGRRGCKKAFNSDTSTGHGWKLAEERA